MPPLQQFLFSRAGTNKHIRFGQRLYTLRVPVVLGQGYVIVKPNIVILWLICGYGYLFFQYALTWFRLVGISKWFI